MVLTASPTGGQGVQVVVLLLGQVQPLSFHVEDLLLCLQCVLCGAEILAKHLLLLALPLQARILELGRLRVVVDVVGADLRVIALLPPEWQLISDTVGKRFWLGESVQNRGEREKKCKRKISAPFRGTPVVG